ncbi:MAG: cytochrome c family protein [Planctomycetota bacterium]
MGIRKTVLIAVAFALVASGSVQLSAQPEQCDPTKVLTYESCARCHANEIRVWQQTPHFQTFEQLSRNPAAREICRKLELRSPKRSDVCINCHYTLQGTADSPKPISGISCESCHGAARDWLELHNDYGGPTVTRESETAAHRQQRLADSANAGMRNTRNVYSIARSCYGCHTVPNEKLVNVGGHNAGSMDFELVAWSQGMVRHNFLRSGGTRNEPSTRERLRVMYVAGLIADLEFSTRATAVATEKSAYGIAVANRAARTALKLWELQQEMNDPNVQLVLESFAVADLTVNNNQQLVGIADEIKAHGLTFAECTEGINLLMVDPYLPDPTEYKQ